MLPAATTTVARDIADQYHDEPEVVASPRSFGLLLATMFLVAGALPWWRGQPVRVWAVAAAVATALVAALAPRALAPLSSLWHRLGLGMHRVVNPVVMGALYFLVVTPFGLVRQCTSRGLTPQLRRDSLATTYWIGRSDRLTTMTDQF